MKLIIIILIICLSRQGIAQDDNDLKFPEGFSIGAATSAYQIEGAWNVSDKSESMWDVLTHRQPSIIRNNDTGDVACDSYHKYKEDVALLKNMGLNHYRFSISWARVLPTGSPDKISKDGMQYYKNLVDELIVNGIEPFVTLHHFDDVKFLRIKTGGWSNESMIDYFTDYARVVFRELGPKVKFWTTFNEINIFCSYYLMQEILPNSAYKARYACTHNILKAHARAYHIYDEEFRPTQGGKVGLIVSGANYYPKVNNDTESTKTAFDFETGWIMHPIFSKTGDYPETMKQKIAENSEAEGLSTSRLPEFSPFWRNYIKGSADYLGLNHYTSLLVESVPKVDGRWYDDSGLKKSQDPKWPETPSSWLKVVPEGLRLILNQIKEAFDNPPVYILENGTSQGPELIDVDRISFLYAYMKQLLLALSDGCNVKAYTVWSLLDNFEWYEGYSQRFGLVHVDFNDSERTRTPKLSSYWLKAVMVGRELIPYNDTIINMMS